MAARTQPSSPWAIADGLSWPAAALLALCAPLLFIHVHYQPTWSFGIGSTTATIALSDVAVLVAATGAVLAGVRLGFAPLRAALPVLVASALLLGWILAATLYPQAGDYRTLVHLVSAAKFAEYGLLALAVPLLLRRRDEANLLFAALTCWSIAASTGAVLQFLGLVNEFEGRRPGQREPSFVGIHDLAALSGAALALALAAVALGPLERRRERVFATAAGVSGAVGLVLSGAAAGVVGVAAAGLAAALLGWLRSGLRIRRLAAVGAIVATAAAGVLVVRGVDLRPVVRAIGVDTPRIESKRVEAESYQQRSVLAYIGWRMFLDHPLLGVGWQGASEASSYRPYLAEARRRFPNVPALALPAPAHPWGIQNAYIQAAAELGAVGFVLFVGLFAAGIFAAARATLRAPAALAPAALVPVLWLLVAMGVWLGLGIVAGIPLVGLEWLGLGVAGAAAAWVEA